MASELSLTDVTTAVRSEYRRIFTERRDDLIAVGFNAGLVTICWFLLPDSILNWLFTLHGALAFPYVLEMWMLGDTPATNVAGRDAVRAVSQLQRSGRAAHLAPSETHRVGSFVGPTAAIVAMVIGVVQQRYEAAAAVAITLLFLAARRAERRRVDRHLAALSPAEVAVALAASFRLARSIASVGSSWCSSPSWSCR